MIYSCVTDRGKRRPTNQDACFAAIMPDNISCVGVVCDGMGGEHAGDIASDLAIKTVSQRLLGGWRKEMSEASVINLLTTAINAANIYVYDESMSHSEYSGMGTTIAAAAVVGDNLITAHAGDSRCYVFNGTLNCLTKDHSMVQEMVDAGTLTKEQARNHPDKNYITRALGVSEHLELDFDTQVLNKTDKVLICSDGLYNFITDERIADILVATKTADAAKALVDEANRNGGGDNITAIVISLEKENDHE